jgi:competence protein ComEC
VVSIPHKAEQRQRFEFAIDSLIAEDIEPELQSSLFKSKVRLSWYNSDKAIKLGQQWQLNVRLKEPNGLLNPGGFDYEKWLYLKRIKATGYVKDGILLSQERTAASAIQSLMQVRQGIALKLDEVLGDYPYKGLVKALSIGSRADIEPYQWQLLLQTGTNHLMAISGLHVGLISGLFWWLTYRIWVSLQPLNLRVPAIYAASVAGFFAALFYSALAGFSIPTQRALIMLALIYLTILSNRETKPGYILMSSLFLVLLYDPLSTLSAGFWLSFAAVAVILYSILAKISHDSSLLGKCLEFSRVQWRIFVGLMPVILLLFHQFNILSPVANFIVVPVMSLVIIPMTLLATVLSWISFDLSSALFNLLQWLLDGVFAYLDYLLNAFPGQIIIPELPIVQIILLFIGIIWLLLPEGWYGRWLGIILILPALMYRPSALESGQFQFTMLDVGQGLAMVVQTRNHTLLYDTGDKYSPQFSMGNAVILPFLKFRGIRKLDTLVVSHSDRDHAGSVNDILQGIEVQNILSGEPLVIESTAANVMTPTKHQSVRPLSQINKQRCHEGQSWIWDEVEFTVLSPQMPLAEVNANNCSCVLLVKSPQGKSVLITGDIEKNIEKQLLKKYPQLNIDILQVPHHGSNTSSTMAFIQQLQPRFALFSYGYQNRFRHPHRSVVKRYKKKKVKLFSTTEGAIDISQDLSNNSLIVKQYRFENLRFWHRQPKPL